MEVRFLQTATDSYLGTWLGAVRDGEVMYTGSLGGYGQVLMLRHNNGFTTLYAHTDVVFVKQGIFLRRGDLVANVGMTGTTTGRTCILWSYEVLRSIIPFPSIIIQIRKLLIQWELGNEVKESLDCEIICTNFHDSVFIGHRAKRGRGFYRLLATFFSFC
ncbi:MAG: M23 family metallopeptidase [Turneriella sp.]|nr:M23 family metallopeptidase [Turneriella sp.]